MRRDDGYQETIEYLYGLQKVGIKLGLDTSARLMESLGSPHRAFRSVHVAGTNGKGSTAAFLAAMLRAAGLRVGLYTSPHLVSFTERIRINDAVIPELRVVELARRVREAHRAFPAAGGTGGPIPTFFEVTTAMAFVYFAEEAVDVAVVEVGMGGRLDSTNVIMPLVSIITNIELEHTQYLGTTLAEIAWEKAGIIKEGVPVVTGVTQPEALTVVETTALEKRAPLYLLARDFQPAAMRSGLEQQFDYRGAKASYASMRIDMAGQHQVRNACLALAAAECLQDAGIPLTEASIRSGLAAARWEGRLERIVERPAIYLDGAHNPAAARVLAAAVREMKASYGRLILIVGILADKDAAGILAELLPLTDHAIITRPEYSRALDSASLASEARKMHRSVSTAETVPEAIAAARGLASDQDLILITGSLYVVGEARTALSPVPASGGALAGLKG